MPRDKSASHVKINRAIKEEFLEKGYIGAYIRSIGQRAGMTSAALYRHYSSKEEMFSAIVEPLVNDINEWTARHRRSQYELVKNNAGKAELFSELLLIWCARSSYQETMSSCC